MTTKERCCFICQKSTDDHAGDVVCLYLTYPFFVDGPNQNNAVCHDCVLKGARRIGQVNTVLFSYLGVVDHVWDSWGKPNWMRARTKKKGFFW